jgi:hypothetical protein
MEGYLTKQGHKNFFSWENRYFVLEANRLSYYENNDKKTLLGRYDFNDDASAHTAHHTGHGNWYV